MTTTFKEFVDKKTREANHQLKTIEKILTKNGFTVDSFLNSENPYIFLNSNDDRLSFGGIRIYKIGDLISYRVQNEKDTFPYGKAYLLDVTGMYNDLLSEDGDEKRAGKLVIKGVINEFKNFFKKSLEAEKSLKVRSGDSDEGDVIEKPNDIDYATLISNRI